MADLALEDASLSSFARECLISARSSSQDLLGVLSRVVDMTAIESGSLRLVLSEFDLAQCALLSLREAQSRRYSIVELRQTGLETWPTLVWGDAARSRQLFIELFDAALDLGQGYGSSASASVDTRGARAYLDVLVPTSSLPSLSFADPFALLADSGSTQSLGLPMCARLAALLGGELTARHDPSDCGVLLSLWLPIEPPPRP